MIELLSQRETTPNQYPSVTGLSTKAQALNQAALWQRIEYWMAWRWGERTVMWVVEGEGDWFPPLTPYTISTAERWTGSEYETITLSDAPLGLRLNGGTYRITANVGSTDAPPDDVLEAFRRLAEYLAEIESMPVGLHSSSMGDASKTFTRTMERAAKALQFSGAADLLRRYRTS